MAQFDVHWFCQPSADLQESVHSCSHLLQNIQQFPFEICRFVLLVCNVHHQASTQCAAHMKGVQWNHKLSVAMYLQYQVAFVRMLHLYTLLIYIIGA